jgi:hypothetical protein
MDKMFGVYQTYYGCCKEEDYHLLPRIELRSYDLELFLAVSKVVRQNRIGRIQETNTPRWSESCFEQRLCTARIASLLRWLLSSAGLPLSDCYGLSVGSAWVATDSVRGCRLAPIISVISLFNLFIGWSPSNNSHNKSFKYSLSLSHILVACPILPLKIQKMMIFQK